MASIGKTMEYAIQPPWDDQAVESAVDQAIASGRSKIKVSRMKIGPYNGFTGDQRLIADRKIKVAIEMALIPVATECSICGETNGRMDYHAENYGRPLQVAAICSKCHLALHNRFRSPGFAASWKKRVDAYGDGSKWFEHIAVRAG